MSYSSFVTSPDLDILISYYFISHIISCQDSETSKSHDRVSLVRDMVHLVACSVITGVALSAFVVGLKSSSRNNQLCCKLNYKIMSLFFMAVVLEQKVNLFMNRNKTEIPLAG